MAESAVQICNNALLKLGVDSITSFTDNTKVARACRLIYPIARDELLRAYFWNFAIVRTQLGQIVDTPLYEYMYMYQLPADCLRVIATYGDYPYKIEGRRILSDSDTLKIKYIQQVTDPSQFEASFSDLLAVKIAKELCVTLTGDGSLIQYLHNSFKEKLQEAKLYDSQEDTPDSIQTTTWLNSRF